MIDRVIEFSIRNRTAVIIAGLALAVWGVVAIIETPVDAIPDLSENQVVVFTDWLGHSPREIEDQITFPLSVDLQGIAGVRVVRSSSDFNFSMINVIFDDSVAFAAGRARVAERLARASQLVPDGVTPELAPESVATGQIYWYTVEGPGYDLGRLRAIQDFFVKHQLASLPGVAEVASVGGFPIEYHIEVNPDHLRQHGVTLSEIVRAVSASNGAVGGHVIEKANAEYIVRSVGWLGGATDEHGEIDSRRVVRDLERVVVRGRAAISDQRSTISAADSEVSDLKSQISDFKSQISDLKSQISNSLLLSDLATISVGPGPRRGVLEKDGVEVTGGVVLMRFGENPLEVTNRIERKIEQLRAGLPAGVRIVPFYDRRPLIHGAIRTVTATLTEAILTAAICVLIVLLHFRTSFIIAITLPLATLASFVVMWALRRLGVADIQTNIMSLAGIAISIGVLVDSSIVMAENVMHHLHEQFGNRPVCGDIREFVLPACKQVGRPIFFSVVIMLLSFLPVFALGGIEGKMFRPLAFTKSFALVAVAVLAITLVPALCTVLIKGRLRSERDSWLVRSFIDVYRPVLDYLLDRPAPLAWLLGVTFIVGLAPLGARWVFLAAVFVAIASSAFVTRSWRTRAAFVASLVLVALVADQRMRPLGREFMTPLDEGMVMDMPITVPRASITQSGDDVKARDMVLCRFPEVAMVVGKAGRAETATDPAPLDMIETMVEFRPAELWPKRRLREADVARQTRAVFDELARRGVIEPPGAADAVGRTKLIEDATAAAVATFDSLMREVAHLKYADFDRELRQLNVPRDERPARWRAQVRTINAELLDRAAMTFTRAAMDELLARCRVSDERVAAALEERKRQQLQQAPTNSPSTAAASSAGHHGPFRPTAPLPDPIPVLDSLRDELAARFARGLMLWPADRAALTEFGGEMDRAVQMPGWTNVWTKPIQNRVDMLATGVNTPVGVRVLGRDLDKVVRASEEIAAAVKSVPGAADVVADPIRGKGYIEVRPDRDRAAEFGVRIGDINDVVETAIGGKVVTTTVEGRERHAVRVRYARDWRQDEEAVGTLDIPVSARSESTVPTPLTLSPSPRGRGEQDGARSNVPLASVADVRVVEGPAKINSENGLLRNYVRMNVRGRGLVEFVDEARRTVAERVRLPEGVYVEWTGQFEHEARAWRTIALMAPVVIGLIFAVLYFTYHDFADAVLMLLAVPGAIAGGVFFQWLFGFKFSVTVGVGYIACFGMATSTGIIMLVYLRDAVARAGGIERLTLRQLREAVLAGAVQRLRPKLLTEGTTIIGLAPMLWATGVGAEVIRPMAAPVLGGILVADEVIDLLLPVLFFWVRRWRWHRLRERGMESAADSRDARIDVPADSPTCLVGVDDELIDETFAFSSSSLSFRGVTDATTKNFLGESGRAAAD